jgi:hypothetical protein
MEAMHRWVVRHGRTRRTPCHGLRRAPQRGEEKAGSFGCSKTEKACAAGQTARENTIVSRTSCGHVRVAFSACGALVPLSRIPEDQPVPLWTQRAAMREVMPIPRSPRA